MTETIAHFFLFFALAFLSGLFWPAFHAMIGAPESVPDESAGLGAQFVNTLKISKPGMIFRRYGEWLCRKQNEFEKMYDKSLLFYAPIPDDIIYTILEAETSYGRHQKSLSDALSSGNEYFRLMPGEAARVKYIYGNIIGDLKQVDLLPVYPNFNRSKIPLSPYKALGLCPNCTVFWIMLSTLIAACFVGLFPPAYFWLILPAYGLAMWGTRIYE